MEHISERFELRCIRPEEAEAAAVIEQICFPPNEACSRDMMLRRIASAPEMFLVAIERTSGKMAGFLNGLATKETVFRDEFFSDISLYDPEGDTVMILGLDVLPEYRMQGLARAIMKEYQLRQKLAGRKRLLLTCLDDRVPMYVKFGFTDLGMSGSVWGGESWHEMRCDL